MVTWSYYLPYQRQQDGKCYSYGMVPTTAVAKTNKQNLIISIPTTQSRRNVANPPFIDGENEAKGSKAIKSVFSPPLQTCPPRPPNTSVLCLSHPLPTNHLELRCKGTKSRKREGGHLLPLFLFNELETACGSGPRTGQTEVSSMHCKVSKVGLDRLMSMLFLYLTSPPL